MYRALSPRRTAVVTVLDNLILLTIEFPVVVAFKTP